MIFCKRELITRHDNDPYLDRFIIFKCHWFSVMLHRFLASDDECLHDHPWPFLSVILRNFYWEWTATPSDEVVGMGPQIARRYRAGSFLFRGARHAHRIEIDPERLPVTLVITGPRVRLWGFFTRFGWLPWFKYSYAEHCS